MITDFVAAKKRPVELPWDSNDHDDIAGGTTNSQCSFPISNSTDSQPSGMKKMKSEATNDSFEDSFPCDTYEDDPDELWQFIDEDGNLPESYKQDPMSIEIGELDPTEATELLSKF